MPTLFSFVTLLRHIFGRLLYLVLPKLVASYHVVPDIDTGNGWSSKFDGKTQKMASNPSPHFCTIQYDRLENIFWLPFIIYLKVVDEHHTRKYLFDLCFVSCFKWRFISSIWWKPADHVREGNNNCKWRWNGDCLPEHSPSYGGRERWWWWWWYAPFCGWWWPKEKEKNNKGINEWEMREKKWTATHSS